ncbi:MAG: hypothetical protein OEL76_02210 [Siculibacillus sp.]|nr:hypothetical protein [Siculibacillus sp.]
MNRRDEIEAERKRASEAALAGVVRDSEVVGTSAFARMARHTGERLEAHFGGGDADPDDRVEVWGRRIGRILGLIFAAALVVHLVRTYVIG